MRALLAPLGFALVAACAHGSGDVSVTCPNATTGTMIGALAPAVGAGAAYGVYSGTDEPILPVLAGAAVTGIMIGAGIGIAVSGCYSLTDVVPWRSASPARPTRTPGPAATPGGPCATHDDCAAGLFCNQVFKRCANKDAP